MKNFKHALRNANASGGYGLALLLVFIASTILVGVSFQMVSTPATIAYLGTASQDNLAAREAALIGLDETETDIRTKLQASTAITTAYRYPASSTNPVYTPSDPTDLASSGIQVGSYYATVSQARGNTFLIKVTATAGNATIELSRLMQANKVTTTVPTSYDCSVVETQILAGNIASVASADLITWAQNNCMIKTASVTMQTPSAGSGSTASCSTYSGSGTISFASLGACTTNVNGTYTTIQLNSSPSATASSYLFSSPASGSRTIIVPGNIGNYSAFKAQTSTGTISTYPHTFIFNATNPASAGELYGGNGDDLMYLNGASTFDLYTRDGANNVYINGTWGTSNNGNYMQLGDTGSTGTNYVYIDNLSNYPANGATLMSYSTGVMKFYFNTIGGDNIYVQGNAGNDIIACGVSFSGGTGSCSGTFAPGNNVMDGAAGSDIISIDASIGTGDTIIGGTGSNIVYIKGCAGTSVSTTSIQPGSSTSLLVIGGNRSADCWANGNGGSSVVLKKSGITEGNSTSSYARTLTY